MGDIYPEHPKLTREKLNEIEQRLGWAPGDRWPVPEHIHLWAWKADALLAENASLRAQLAQAREALRGAASRCVHEAAYFVRLDQPTGAKVRWPGREDFTLLDRERVVAGAMRVRYIADDIWKLLRAHPETEKEPK